MTNREEPPSQRESARPGCFASALLLVVALFVSVLGVCSAHSPVWGLAKVLGDSLQSLFVGFLLTVAVLFGVLYLFAWFIRRDR
jgi:hypothetical protein